MVYEYQERTLEQVLRHRRSYNDPNMTVRLFGLPFLFFDMCRNLRKRTHGT